MTGNKEVLDTAEEYYYHYQVKYVNYLSYVNETLRMNLILLVRLQIQHF